MDVPAATLAVVAGILLIGTTLPFAILALPQAPKEYLVAWTQDEAGRKPLQAAGDGSSEAQQQVELTLQGQMVANVTVTLVPGACADTFAAGNPYGQQAVRIKWDLFRREAGNETRVDGSAEAFTCADVASGLARAYAQGTHPDVGSIKAADEDEAHRILDTKAAGTGRTVTYVLKVAWTRPPAQPAGGLPLGGLPTAPATSFALGMELAASHWSSAIQPKPEAGK